MLSLFGVKPGSLGVCDGRLAPCPNKPNCVSSQAADPRHAIEPISFTGSVEVAMERLRRVLRECPRTRIITDQRQYIHAESRSRVFRFVDDLEFLADEAENVIHLRSASRLGRSDLGVNRRRAEAIRSAFKQLVQSEEASAAADD